MPEPQGRGTLAPVLKRLREGYDRRSVISLTVLFLGYLVVWLQWPWLIDLNAPFDPLLTLTWGFMTAALAWGVSPRRDIVRALVGLAGGLCIEAWGTVAGLWAYWTTERPPLWIVPAWAVSGLAIDRIARFIRPSLGPASEKMATPVLLVFAAWFAWFARGSFPHPATLAAFAAMIAVPLLPGNRREDLALFVGGSALGVCLETWGTTHGVWYYVTKEAPPLEAVLAHGFAAVAFQRAAGFVDRALERLQAVREKRAQPRAATTVISSRS